MPANEIQSGRFNAILRKLMGMDVGAPSPTLATDIFPTVCLESERPEWDFLANQRLGYAGTSIAAVAAQQGQLALANPDNSGMLVILDAVDLWFGTAALIGEVRYITYAQWYANFSYLNTYSRDSRLFWSTAARRMAGVCGYYTGAAIGNLASRTPGSPVAYQSVRVKGPWVLGPGAGISFLGQNNTGIGATFCWRERELSPSETR